MKKIFFPALAIAAIALASCAKQEIIDTDDHPSGSIKPINFDVSVRESVEVNTKASILTETKLKSTGFIVHAYNTGRMPWANYTPSDVVPNWTGDLAGRHVEFSDPSWHSSSPLYWPDKSSALTFFAYAADRTVAGGAPVGLTNFTGQAGIRAAAPKFDFTVQDLPTDQVDLIAAKDFDNVYSTESGKVSLNFVHILSSIWFNAKLASERADATVTVKSVKVKYATNVIQSNGTFTFDSIATNKAAGTWTLAPTASYLTSSDYVDILTSDVVLRNTIPLYSGVINDNDIPDGDSAKSFRQKSPLRKNRIHGSYYRKGAGDLLPGDNSARGQYAAG